MFESKENCFKQILKRKSDLWDAPLRLVKTERCIFDLISLSCCHQQIIRRLNWRVDFYVFIPVVILHRLQSVNALKLNWAILVGAKNIWQMFWWCLAWMKIQHPWWTKYRAWWRRNFAPPPFKYQLVHTSFLSRSFVAFCRHVLSFSVDDDTCSWKTSPNHDMYTEAKKL